MSRSEKRNRYGVPIDNYAGTALRYNQSVHFFELRGHKYSAQQLDPLQQVHIARRLAPILLGAVKPEQGRKAIIACLASMASLAASQDEGVPKDVTTDQVIADAIDLATSVLGAAAAADEETVNTIIRKCMSKIWREKEEGRGGMPLWDTKNDQPAYDDIDGFTMLALVVRYLIEEFRDSIVEYIGSLDLKPGPALKAAAGLQPRPPGAPGAE